MISAYQMWEIYKYLYVNYNLLMKKNYIIKNVGAIDIHTRRNDFAIKDYAYEGSQSHSKDRICCAGEIHLALCVCIAPFILPEEFTSSVERDPVF